MIWAVEMCSDEYGCEVFKPYDTEDEAWEGVQRLARRAAELNDGIVRYYRVFPWPEDDEMDNAETVAL